MNIAAFIIRMILTILLLIGIYSETGPWTTIAFTLTFFCHELTAFIFRAQGLSK